MKILPFVLRSTYERDIDYVRSVGKCHLKWGMKTEDELVDLMFKYDDLLGRFNGLQPKRGKDGRFVRK